VTSSPASWRRNARHQTVPLAAADQRQSEAGGRRAASPIGIVAASWHQRLRPGAAPPAGWVKRAGPGQEAERTRRDCLIGKWPDSTQRRCELGLKLTIRGPRHQQGARPLTLRAWLPHSHFQVPAAGQQQSSPKARRPKGEDRVIHAQSKHVEEANRFQPSLPADPASATAGRNITSQSPGDQHRGPRPRNGSHDSP